MHIVDEVGSCAATTPTPSCAVRRVGRPSPCGAVTPSSGAVRLTEVAAWRAPRRGVIHDESHPGGAEGFEQAPRWCAWTEDPDTGGSVGFSPAPGHPAPRPPRPPRPPRWSCTGQRHQRDRRGRAARRIADAVAAGGLLESRCAATNERGRWRRSSTASGLLRCRDADADPGSTLVLRRRSTPSRRYATCRPPLAASIAVPTMLRRLLGWWTRCAEADLSALGGSSRAAAPTGVPLVAQVRTDELWGPVLAQPVRLDRGGVHISIATPADLGR